MAGDGDERLANELALLEAMYSDQIIFDQHSRELKYTNDGGAFTLRIPDGYLIHQLPDVLSASIGKSDQREHLRQHVKSMAIGEEVLDAIITAFMDIFTESSSNENKTSAQDNDAEPVTMATVVIWLHHLLNTNKRKQALSPASPGVSGITKPGYPGVLIYTGPFTAVYQHVNELKSLNWQAFQTRLETEEEWPLAHGHGVKEVETMKEVVAEVGEARKELFMEAMRMK